SLRDHCAVVLYTRPRIARHIRDAKPAAEIDAPYLMPVGAQLPHELGDTPKRGTKGVEIGDLAADMNGNADGAHTRQRFGTRKNLAHARPSDAEFVLGLAGRDL